jgi:hypothetical protein
VLLGPPQSSDGPHGGFLAPLSAGSGTMRFVSDHVKVFVEDGGAVESLWAEALGDGLYRIDSIPFEIWGLSLGDVVRASQNDDGILVFDGVYDKSGAGTFHIHLSDGLSSAVGQELLAFLTARELPYEVYGEGVLAVSTPREADSDEVRERCQELRVSYRQAGLGDATSLRVVPGSPQERQPTAEERLLRAIFGDTAGPGAG